jgi:outer membrane protein TolC
MTRLFAAVLILLMAPCTWAQPAVIRLSVADAVARGHETSHRLAELRAREQGAQASTDGAKAAHLPVLSATAGYTRTNHVTEFAIPPEGPLRVVFYPDVPDNFYTRLSMQWPIYTAGRTNALERAAAAEASAVGADLDAARADLKLEIVRTYWAVATAREAVRVLEESSARAEAQLTDARQRFGVGLIPPNEVSSLEAQRSRERAQLIEAQNLRESALIDLRRLIGAPPETVLELSDHLDATTAPLAAQTAADLVAQAMQSRPERKALVFRLGGAEARRQAATTGNKPTVALAGGYDFSNPNPKIFPRREAWQYSFDFGVSVNWNFLDFGRTKAQVSEASATITAVRERMAEVDTVISADVRQRLLDLDSSQAMVRAASDAVRSAADARRVVGDRYSAGVATATDVLVAQVALLENELARTRAMAAVRLAEARLERALGR